MAESVKDHGVFAAAERWKTLREDPEFIAVVTLGRVANSLSLAYPPLLGPLEDQSPRARRERFAAFFYAAALLYEGLRYAEHLGKYFRELPQYKAGFAVLLGDSEVAALRSGALKRVRNELGFHFDTDSFAAGLRHFPDGEALLATATEFKQGEIHFDIADDALLAYLCGGAPSEDEYLAGVERLLSQVTQLFQRFMRASHSLIPAVLSKMGCYVKAVDRPVAPADRPT